ncbi:hypothetical protein HHL23_22105 [Chryseobacterium sp. RP-3-3]|uniref:Uncharacterized protein n=1 Tax=Chryseobacterium antibioticum TaxID=2728847 RepID=A0A7Y0AS13_9FLAO|nr:three component ABC system middle component [Chryseobacterium antibioticum]NML72453.1 hypothetical protein [Chryseobacterium antibioticum]
MREVYYIFNNEAISCCIFLSVFQKIDAIDVSRACIILPFLLDERTVSFLNKVENVANYSLEQFIAEQPRLFVSFNKRYLSLLPITINSLMVLKNSKQIKIDTEIRAMSTFAIEGDEVSSERFILIENAIPQLLTLIAQKTTTQLYKMLNIQL